MEYSFRKCTLEDFDFLFNLKKENFKFNFMLIKYGVGKMINKNELLKYSKMIDCINCAFFVLK